LEGKLAGRVIDQNEAVIPNVEILIESKNFKIRVTSDGEGNYAVQLPTGTYRLSVVSPRFHKFGKKNVRVDYETLEQSSQGWHEGKHDPWPYINYTLYSALLRRREFFTDANQKDGH